jgi:hypothetical protein
MKIVDAKVIVCSPGRNFVTLKLTTEDGITRLGDATLNGRELSVASYLTDHDLPLLIGRDARRIEVRSAQILTANKKAPALSGTGTSEGGFQGVATGRRDQPSSLTGTETFPRNRQSAPALGDLPFPGD